MQVVEDPQRVQTFLTRDTALLPINPPKIDAISLQIMMHIEIGANEVRIRQIKLHRFFAGWVNSHCFGGLGIGILTGTYSIAGMHIRRNTQAPFMQGFRKSMRVWN